MKMKPLYVMRPVKNAEEIIKYFKSEGFETTLLPNDLHVTILYSEKAADWNSVTPSQNDLKIPLNYSRKMKQFDTASVLTFSSLPLYQRNRDLVKAGFKHAHPEYSPHITISYKFKGDLSKVQPWFKKIILGPEKFELLDSGPSVYKET